MNDLVSRWLEDVSLTKKVLRRLKAGQSLGSLVESVDGRADLRGYVFPSTRVLGELSVGGQKFFRTTKKLQFRGIVWDSIDFTGANLAELMFVDCTLRNLEVVRANLVDSGVWGCRIVDCQFISSDMRSFCVSSDKAPSVWRRTILRRCDLRDAALSGGLFDETEFHSIKTNGLNVTSSSFLDARFSGVLTQINFDNRQSESLQPIRELRVDFSEADLRDVAFRGWQFANVAMPEGVGWFPKLLAVSTRVIEFVESEPSEAARIVSAVVRNMVRGVDDESADGDFNPSEWRRFDKDGTALRLYETALYSALDALGLQIRWGSNGS